MLPHETAELFDFSGDNVFKLNDFCYGEEGGQGTAAETVEVVRHGALHRAGDAELSCYPPVLVKLESVAVEVIIIIWVVDVKLVRTDADNGA